MAPSKKSSTSRPKPSKGRPLSTSEISQSTLANTLPILSSFSLDGSLFAIITLSVDKHRLRVYNTTTGRALAEHTVESPRVSALTWAVVKLSSGTSGKEPSSPSKRKKKRVDSDVAVDEGEGLSTTTTVVLGLSNGAISFFSPSQSRIVRTLSASASTSSIVSMAIGPDSSTLWTSGADGTLRLWNIDKNEILSSWKNDDCIPYTSLSLRPTNDRSRMDILAAHHHIQILSATTDAHNPTTRKPTKLASFTGHASSVKSLCWENADISNRFFSAAEGDRFIYVWDFVEGSSSSENPLASVALDSDVRAITISPGLSKKTLVALSASGKLTFYPVPETFSPPPSAGDKIPTLLPRSTAATLPKGRTSGPPVIDLVSVPGDSGSIRVVRLVGGIRPVFDLLRYMDDDGNFIQNVTLEDVGHDPTGNALLRRTKDMSNQHHWRSVPASMSVKMKTTMIP
ncbi:WD40-repeat-containing domain protein [Crassisporium funariophilum]|nr:WD40-repeat-containing domain protein [Crassisporium funariophilum]